MALRFVKTSVLTSEDGIDFSTETVVESEEQRSIRLNAENAAQRPLYMQLQEQQDKKQAEYDAITKQIFAPPKGLDEEEFGFISALEEVKYRKEKLRQTEEAKAMEEFRYALRANQSEDNNNQTKRPVVTLAPEPATNAPILPQIKFVKRKIDKSVKGNAKELHHEKKQKHDAEAITTSVEVVDSKGEVKEAPTKAKTEESETVGALSFMMGYGSDEEVDDT